MKIDTSSYYPKSPLDDDNESPEGSAVESEKIGEGRLFPESEEKKEDHAEEPTEEMVSEEETTKDLRSEPQYDPTDTERFLDNVSTAISWILVPLLMPVYGILLAFNLSILEYMPFSTKLTFTLIVGGINLVVPALLVILLKRVGIVQDLGLNGRKERFIPYIITIIAMAGTGLFVYFKHAPMWLVMFFAGGGVAGLVNLLINFRWKISAHSAAMAGVVALLIRIMHDGTPMPGVFTWIIIWVALCGFLGSARVWLGRHTPAQVLAGYAVGFLSVFFMTMIG